MLLIFGRFSNKPQEYLQTHSCTPLPHLQKLAECHSFSLFNTALNSHPGFYQFSNAHVCITKMIIPIAFSKFFDVLLSAFIHALCHFIAERACVLPWNQILGAWFRTALDLDLSSLAMDCVSCDDGTR